MILYRYCTVLHIYIATVHCSSHLKDQVYARNEERTPRTEMGVFWFASNLVLVYDVVHMLFGPFKSSGMLIQTMFSPLDYYATLDAAFNPADITVRCIYIVCIADILAQIAIFAAMIRRPDIASDFTFAMCVVIQLTKLATKNLVYLMYSASLTEGLGLIPMTLINGMWCTVLAMLIFTTMRRCAQTVNKPKQG